MVQTATSGKYRLTYKGYKTNVLDYNEDASDIAEAIEGLAPFDNNATDVTVSGALSADDITITYGGKLAELEPEELIYVEPYDMNDGANNLYYDSVLTTEYVPGFPSGSASYRVAIVGVRMQRLRIETDGSISIFKTCVLIG